MAFQMTRVLVVEGQELAALKTLLRTARSQGCEGLSLLARGETYAVCLASPALDKAGAEAWCGQWEGWFRASLGGHIVRVETQTSAPEKEAPPAAPREKRSAMEPARPPRLTRPQRARRWGAAAAAVLVAAVGGAAALRFARSLPGSPPQARGYGTVAFDKAAQTYLDKSAARGEAVAAYLAWSGKEGALLYAEEAGRENSLLTEATREAGNTVISLAEALPAEGEALEAAMAENMGFSLYVPGGEAVYRYRVAAVYAYDPADEVAPFDPAESRDLAEADAYETFVANIRARSVYDFSVQIREADAFATVQYAPDAAGVRWAVTGRLVRDNESSALTATHLRASDSVLYTNAQYIQKGEAPRDASAVLKEALAWYQGQKEKVEAPAESPPPAASEDASSAAPAQEGPGVDIGALSRETQAILVSTDELIKGLTDVAGASGASEDNVYQGAAGTVGTDISIEAAVQKEAPVPTPAPTEAPAPAPEQGGEEQPSAPAEPPAAETIKVTMNGSPMELDLVECLAMIVQNEMGSGQPAEAYKAQAVAAHSWILSQGEYPSVGGTSPTEAVRSAVREVARKLVTYNGRVCFTPYCASVSTGTISAGDYWGAAKPYLQAVESPYDRDYATHWNTNGEVSGTARFARDTVVQRVRDKLGIDLNAIENPGDWFQILSTNQYGYVTQMRIGNDASGSTTCSGRWFRENLLLKSSVDGRTIRSAAFTFRFDDSLGCFLFDVYGYGHGVGMSQRGAVGYAANGWNYEQILTHYYTGAAVTSY